MEDPDTGLWYVNQHEAEYRSPYGNKQQWNNLQILEVDDGGKKKFGLTVQNKLIQDWLREDRQVGIFALLGRGHMVVRWESILDQFELEPPLEYNEIIWEESNTKLFEDLESARNYCKLFKLLKI